MTGLRRRTIKVETLSPADVFLPAISPYHPWVSDWKQWPFNVCEGADDSSRPS